MKLNPKQVRAAAFAQTVIQSILFIAYFFRHCTNSTKSHTICPWLQIRGAETEQQVYSETPTQSVHSRPTTFYSLGF